MTTKTVKQSKVDDAPTNGTSGASAPNIVPAPEVRIQPAGWTAIRSLAEALQVAELVGKSNAFPDVTNPGKALVKILAGAEMGFGPFASLVDVHIIEGKPSVGAHLKAAAIRRSDHYDFDVVEQDEAGTVCDLAFWERKLAAGGEVRKRMPGWVKVGHVRLTMEACVAKGLTQGKGGTKNNWRTSPDDMLFARCISKGYRRYCPDLSGGVLAYDPDELDSPAEPIPLKRPEPGDVIDAEYTVETTQLPVATHQQTSSPMAITQEQIDRLDYLITKLGLTPEQLASKLKAACGVESVLSLSAAQADEVAKRMEVSLKKAAAPPT